MDVIIANEELKEIGILPHYASLDLEVGGENDFELTIPLNEYEQNKHLYGIDYLVFVPNTEYGGIIKDIKVDTADNSVVFCGDSWRGMLSKKVISPTLGQDYKTVSGEANGVIKTIIDNAFGSFIQADTANSGIAVNGYQFSRYCTLLDGLSAMLGTASGRLGICVCYDPSGSVYVRISAVSVVDLSDTIEASQDTLVDFRISKFTRTINHLICLGSGELKDRTVKHLYLQAGGVIGADIHYIGIDERVAVYDYGSVESEAELVTYGIKRLQELNTAEGQELNVKEDIDADIGDIVGGRDRITDVYIKAKVTRKIITVTNGYVNIEYKVGD